MKKYIKFFLILIIGFVIYFAYHYMVQNDISSLLTKIDIYLTTGFKPALPIIELGIFPMFITYFISSQVFDYKESSQSGNRSMITLILHVILIIYFLSLQLVHIFYNHANRWHLNENWTYPGDTVEIGWQRILSSLLIIVIGMGVGFKLNEFIEKLLKD